MWMTESESSLTRWRQTAYPVILILKIEPLAKDLCGLFLIIKDDFWINPFQLASDQDHTNPVY